MPFQSMNEPLAVRGESELSLLSKVKGRGLAAMRPACHLDTQNTVF